MKNNKLKLYALVLAALFSSQSINAQNLLTDPSCEANYGINGSSSDTHFTNTWTIESGSAQCFNAASLGVPTSAPSEGAFFFADGTSAATGASQMSQTVDLGADQSGKIFFYSYDYRMSDMIARATHTVDVEIYFLDASNTTIGTMHNNAGFTDTVLDGNYITVSGIGTAPTGTRKIKWTVRWAETGWYNEVIMDNFILNIQPTHDICENAIPMSCGDYIIGQTHAATTNMTINDSTSIIDQYAICQDLPQFGVFYSFVGTGKPMEVSTDHAYTDYDTQVAIYTAVTCSFPVCVAHNDDVSPFSNCATTNLKSTVSFPTTAGQTYYIYVNGNTGCIDERGYFGLSLDCFIPEQITCGQSISSTTVGATNDYELVDYNGAGGCPAVFSNYTGGDVAYELTVTETTQYIITLSGLTADQDLILVEVDGQGNFISCINISGEVGTTDELIHVILSSGNYLIIVDGWHSIIQSPFTLNIICINLSTNTATLDLKVLLQGPLKSGTPFPVMDTKLRANSLVPIIAPGTSGTAATNGIPTDIVDWVTVELRDATDNTIVKATQECLLRQDGKVLSADGSPNVVFSGLLFTSAYVVVRHRNHLGIMTGSVVSF